jgi:hypothetical protein
MLHIDNVFTTPHCITPNAVLEMLKSKSQASRPFPGMILTHTWQLDECPDGSPAGKPSVRYSKTMPFLPSGIALDAPFYVLHHPINSTA